EIDGSVINRNFLRPFGAQQLIDRLLQDLARQIPQGHGARAQWARTDAEFAIIQIEWVLPQQLDRRSLRRPAVANAFNATIGVDSQHRIGPAITVDIQPCVLTRQLRSLTDKLKPDDS